MTESISTVPSFEQRTRAMSSQSRCRFFHHFWCVVLVLNVVALVQAQSPSNRNPTPTTPPSLVNSDVASDPLTSPFDDASCSGNQFCALLPLTGNCCPTDDNDILDCCYATGPPAADVSSDIPTPSGVETLAPSLLSAQESDRPSRVTSGNDVSDRPSDRQSDIPSSVAPTVEMTSDPVVDVDEPTSEPTLEPTRFIKFSEPTLKPTTVTRGSSAQSIWPINGVNLLIVSFVSIYISLWIVK
jgi:hypothetical protein